MNMQKECVGLSRVLRWSPTGPVVFPVRSGRLVRPGHMLTYLLYVSGYSAYFACCMYMCMCACVRAGGAAAGETRWTPFGARLAGWLAGCVRLGW